MTGSLAQLNIRNVQDETIADHWKGGTRTSMGIAIPGFPNMFFLYGPQAPTAFSNGPSCTQFQAEFVEEMMKKVLADKITRIDAKKEAEEDWCRRMYVAFPPTRKQKKKTFSLTFFLRFRNEKWNATLFPLAKSWYQGANIPGRKVEPLNWAGGMVEYTDSLHKSLDNHYQGWNVYKEGVKV